MENERGGPTCLEEAELTADMIQAGAKVLRLYDPREDDSEDTVIEIYRAMRRVNDAAKRRAVFP